MTQERQQKEGSVSQKFRSSRRIFARRRRLLPFLACALCGTAVFDSLRLRSTPMTTAAAGNETLLPLFAAVVAPHLAQHEAPGRRKGDLLTAEETGLFETLTTETGSSLRDRILRLGLRSDRFALAQLLDVAASEPLEGDERARLALALALSRHLHGDQRFKIVRALIRLLKDGAPESTKIDPLTFRTDATIALILAQSAAPDGLAVLLAHASAWDDTKRMTLIARVALRAHPPSTSELRDLPSVISPSTARRGQEATQSDSSTVAREKERLASLTVSQLLTAYRERRIAQTLSSLARYPEQLPRGLLSKREWKKVLATQPSAALRILALLSTTATPSLRGFTLRHAASKLTTSDPVLRSAAAWTYSALRSPSDTRPSTPHPASAEAIRLGQLPFSCRARLDGKLPARWNTPLTLERCALPPSAVSTTELWKLQEEHFLPMVFQLSARFSDRTKTWRSPSVAQLRDWLASKDPHTRAAAAKGLGFSGAGSAIGLLQASYLEESSVEVRRAIVQALHRVSDVRTPNTGASEDPVDPILSFASNFDPDAACRSFAVGGADPEKHGFVALQGAKGEVKVTSRLGVEYTGQAAPDGFFGIVSGEF